ncbi:hypothetical protein DL96DRAFT_1608336 [Flagelloscypha sp. PMI_526]|nr:hypothetical protein DL96DRAFT_1608336 [Flagelloscypha sp. PMI_526]
MPSSPPSVNTTKRAKCVMECPYCDSKFVNRMSFEKHLLLRMFFSSNPFLKNSLALTLSTDANESIHRCKACAKKFSTVDMLSIHLKNCIPMGITLASCDACRSAKLRCDQGKPCSQCRARGSPCTVTTSSPKLKTKKSPKSKAAQPPSPRRRGPQVFSWSPNSSPSPARPMSTPSPPNCSYNPQPWDESILQQYGCIFRADQAMIDYCWDLFFGDSMVQSSQPSPPYSPPRLEVTGWSPSDTATIPKSAPPPSAWNGYPLPSPQPFPQPMAYVRQQDPQFPSANLQVPQAQPLWGCSSAPSPAPALEQWYELVNGLHAF